MYGAGWGEGGAHGGDAHVVLGACAREVLLVLHAVQFPATAHAGERTQQLSFRPTSTSLETPFCTVREGSSATLF